MEGDTSHVRLSVGYGGGHIVVEMDDVKMLESILAFIAMHRADTAAHWMEVGHFSSCPVTFSLTHDLFIFIVDSDLPPDSFPQSCGLHIPKEFLDEFVDALSREQKRYIEKPVA